MSRKANSSLDQPERKDRDWRACRRLTMLSFAFSRKRVKLQNEDDHQGQFVRRVTDGSKPTFNVFSALLFRLRWSRSFSQLVNYAAASGCNRDPNPVSRAVFALELFRLSTNARRKRVNRVRATKSWSLIFFLLKRNYSVAAYKVRYGLRKFNSNIISDSRYMLITVYPSVSYHLFHSLRATFHARSFASTKNLRVRALAFHTLISNTRFFHISHVYSQQTIVWNSSCHVFALETLLTHGKTLV